VAKRRMFSLDVVDTDKFLELPATSQSLYFHLGMRADDDGFVSSPRRITSMVNCSNDDLKLLMAKGFLIPFENGIVVITDWKVNNYIQKDRYNETQYLDEKKLLGVKDNGCYTLIKVVDTKCIQGVRKTDTQVRLGKDSIDKVSIKEKIYLSLKFIDDVIDKVKITQEQYNKLVDKFNKDIVHKNIIALDNYIANGKGNKYKDHFRALNVWCSKDNGINISSNKEGQASNDWGGLKQFN
jgi:hypothetical protein